MCYKNFLFTFLSHGIIFAFVFKIFIRKNACKKKVPEYIIWQYNLTAIMI